METPVNYFETLLRVNVSGHVEKKSGFSYLSWPFAVAELRKRHPDATWEVMRFDGRPYMDTQAGVFVEVAVTVNGITLSQIHPVLDHRNKPIKEPNAFDINTSIQRALVKAIALHGLGLGVYAGEDLPLEEREAKNEANEAEFNALLAELDTAAEGGTTKLMAAFKAVPASEVKVAVWKEHGAALKALAAKRDAAA